MDDPVPYEVCRFTGGTVVVYEVPSDPSAMEALASFLGWGYQRPALEAAPYIYRRFTSPRYIHHSEAWAGDFVVVESSGCAYGVSRLAYFLE